MQTCYFYDAENFSFKGKGIYQDTLPPNSTNIAPGEQTPFSTFIFGGSAWSVVHDYRNARLFSTTDGTITQSNLGLGDNLPEGFTVVAPPDFPNVYPTRYKYQDNAWVADQTKVDLATAASIRSNRNAMLAATDYIVGSDVPVTTQCLNLFKTYRQSLRDIPQQQGFPNSIDWPVAPTYTKLTN